MTVMSEKNKYDIIKLCEKYKNDIIVREKKKNDITVREMQKIHYCRRTTKMALLSAK
jgi:hypothetical protein